MDPCRVFFFLFRIPFVRAPAFVDAPSPSLGTLPHGKHTHPFLKLPARAPSHADTSRAGLFTPRSLVDSFVPIEVRVRSRPFVRSLSLSRARARHLAAISANEFPAFE